MQKPWAISLFVLSRNFRYLVALCMSLFCFIFSAYVSGGTSESAKYPQTNCSLQELPSAKVEILFTAFYF